MDGPTLGACVIAGPGTLPHAAETLSIILAHDHNGSPAAIDCTGVTGADLSLVQILLAARDSALSAGGTQALAHVADGPLETALRRGGFLHPDTSPELLAFWGAAA